MESVHVIDAGVMAYRPAWDLQLQVHDEVLGGKYPGGALILVEHLPVMTIGRRTDAERHLLASPAMLQARGVEVVETDRGGDITFHGPGQLVAYPIVPLNAYGLNLHAYLRLIEHAVIDAIAPFGIEGMCDVAEPRATGVWVPTTAVRPVTVGNLAKIAAIGIKVRRWITLHGLALNVSTDLSFFGLINPCGLSRPVTSMQKMLGERCPGMEEVKRAVVNAFSEKLRIENGERPRGGG